MKLLRFLLIVGFLLEFREAALRFTNLKCDTLDPDCGVFTTCRLKAIRRGIIALNVYWKKVYPHPFTNLSIHVSFSKKANGYKPFLYNITQDFCAFMRNRKKYPVLKLVFDAINIDSNVNHTCPYNQDVIVRNLILDEAMFRYAPLPNGDYMIRIKVGVDNEWKSDFKVYFTIDLGDNN